MSSARTTYGANACDDTTGSRRLNVVGNSANATNETAT
jgi:hypothetical protein